MLKHAYLELEISSAGDPIEYIRLDTNDVYAAEEYVKEMYPQLLNNPKLGYRLVERFEP